MTRLVQIKLLHTAVWFFFAGCIVAIPIVVRPGPLPVGCGSDRIGAGRVRRPRGESGPLSVDGDGSPPHRAALGELRHLPAPVAGAPQQAHLRHAVRRRRVVRLGAMADQVMANHPCCAKQGQSLVRRDGYASGCHPPNCLNRTVPTRRRPNSAAKSPPSAASAPDARPGVSRSRSARVGRDTASRAPRADRRHRPRHDLHDLRDRPSHSEGRRAVGDRGPDPRARGYRGGHRGRGGRHHLSRRRPRPDLVHHLVRPLRLLPEADVLPLSPWWLDPWEHHRRHPGRLRAHPVCGYQSLRDPGRR